MKAVLILMLGVVQAQAMNLDTYLAQVTKNNKLMSSYDLSIESSNDKRVAGDLSLAPTLTAGYSQATDKSKQGSFATADERDLRTISLGLSKQFSSGTQVSLLAQTFKNDYINPVNAGNSGYSTGNLGVSLTQSLWKNFFGSATRLRQSRELITNKYEVLSYELQKRVSLVQAESDFWDYIVALEDLKLKKDNLDRAQKLEKWTSNRVYNGISDQSDLLQVKALSSSRELELINAEDELKSEEVKIKENLGLKPEDAVPNFEADLTDKRPYVDNLINKKNVVKIDDYLNTLDAQVREKAALEAQDSVRPDLALTGQYKTSSYDADYDQMQSNIAQTDRPVTYVGVAFTWMFGADAVSAQISSAKKAALAARYKAEQSMLESGNAWTEQLRKYEITKQNVETLAKIAQLQRDRSKEEQSKFSKGRSVTTNVVNAETDAAEAEVNYLKAKSGLRKFEASTQLFMSIEE